MNVEFSKDVVPISDVKVNPSKIIRHASEVRRPVLLTNRGRGVAVLQSLDAFEQSEE